MLLDDPRKLSWTVGYLIVCIKGVCVGSTALHFEDEHCMYSDVYAPSLFFFSSFVPLFIRIQFLTVSSSYRYKLIIVVTAFLVPCLFLSLLVCVCGFIIIVVFVPFAGCAAACHFLCPSIHPLLLPRDSPPFAIYICACVFDSSIMKIKRSSKCEWIFTYYTTRSFIFLSLSFQVICVAIIILWDSLVPFHWPLQPNSIIAASQLAAQ